MTIDMSQFYQVFFEETAEHLANMESLLLGLDVDAPSLEDLNAIFRAAHSIKGGSGTFGFTDMTGVTHILETLLDRLRKEELPLQAEMVDAFLAAGDTLRAMLEHHQGGPEPDAEAVAEISARLGRLAEDQPVGGEAAAAPVSMPAQARRVWLSCALPTEVSGNEAAIDNLLEALRELAAVDLSHRPDPTDPRLIAWLTTPLSDTALRDELSFYASAEDIQCSANGPTEEAAYGLFEGAPGASVEEEAYGFFADSPGVPVDAQADTPADAPATVADDDSFGLFEDAPGRPDFQHAEPIASGDAPAALEGDGYGIFIDAPGGMGLFANAPGSPPALDGTPGQGAKTDKAKADPASFGRRASDHPAVQTAKSGRRDNDKVVTAASSEASSIRVSVEKVDQLINLVGELVITQAMIADAAGYLDPVEAEKLLSGVDLLARNTRDLQESVMSIRMLPMSMVFSRFPRVVRDVAGKLGKQVELRTVGENTELDKGLTEKITDPLTHLVRNSLDHGIETPEVRVAAGKPPKGVLTLKASHQGGNIVIEVIDDGAGLNRAKILAKAREKGLNVHDGMSDGEVWQIIFAPGFSTADVVTDVSGRGVGMDVVKRNIEGMGGKVEMESMAGQGTRTVIRLPLTLAILDGMSVGVGGETFIVPLTAIIESLLPGPDDIKTMAGDSRLLHIRGEYLPVISLAEVFGQTPGDQAGQGIAVVVEAEQGKAALIVDELLGQHQVVIKNLEANYRKVPGISGATIMGDGRVALILDIATVTSMGLASHKQAPGRQAA